MEYCLFELQISGNAAKIFSILEKGETKTSFHKFLEKYNSTYYSNEIKDIVKKLKIMGSERGARLCYFKDHEGSFGDKVVALCDIPTEKIRLYCIRYSDNLLIIGGGGAKPPGVNSWQKVPELKPEGEKMKIVSMDMRDYFFEHKWNKDKYKLLSNFKNYE